MGKELAAAAKEDAQLKQLIENLGSLYAPEEDLFESFIADENLGSLYAPEEDLFESFIADLESSGSDEVPSDEEGFLTFSVWKDESGRTAGFEISVFGGTDPQTGEDSVVSFVYQNPQQENNSGLSISFSDGTNYLDLQGSGTITDGKLCLSEPPTGEQQRTFHFLFRWNQLPGFTGKRNHYRRKIKRNVHTPL